MDNRGYIRHAIELSGQPGGLVPLRELAQVSNLSRCAVWRYLRLGRLPGVKVGRRWFVYIDGLARHCLEAMKRKAAKGEC